MCALVVPGDRCPSLRCRPAGRIGHYFEAKAKETQEPRLAYPQLELSPPGQARRLAPVYTEIVVFPLFQGGTASILRSTPIPRCTVIVTPE